MEVNLIYMVDDPIELLYLAARSCRTDSIFDDTKTHEEKENLIRSLIKVGHESILEHLNFTFYIYGISRVCSHQLVRHRLASYAQFSHRRVDDHLQIVLPASTAKDARIEELCRSLCSISISLYKEMLKSGYTADEARYVLPMGLGTSLMMTINARSLRNLFRLRLDKTASFEIRDLAHKMFLLVYPFCSVVFEDINAEYNIIPDKDIKFEKVN